MIRAGRLIYAFTSVIALFTILWAYWLFLAISGFITIIIAILRTLAFVIIFADINAFGYLFPIICLRNRG